MPVVTVTLPPDAATPALLREVADAIANALGLGPGAVLAMTVAAGPVVGSGGTAAGTTWPLVSIHGSDRGDDPVTRARRAAEAAIHRWAEREGRDLGGVWSEWIVPQPPRA